MAVAVYDEFGPPVGQRPDHAAPIDGDNSAWPYFVADLPRQVDGAAVNRTGDENLLRALRSVDENPLGSSPQLAGGAAAAKQENDGQGDRRQQSQVRSRC